MKNVKNIALTLLAVAIIGGAMTGCVKIDEDECIEIIRRPQIDIDPQLPGWEDGGTENMD